MNEFDLINEVRPEVAPYDPGTKAMARNRLLASSSPRRRRPYALALAGALAVAAAAVVVTSAADPAPASAAEVLDRAARAVVDEIDPRDDQFIVVKTLQMNAPNHKNVPHYYGRYEDIVWLRAGERQPGQVTDGVMKQTFIEPLPYDGRPIPKSAYEGVGDTRIDPVIYCKDSRTDYPSLTRLPTDAKGMRAYIADYWRPKAKEINAGLAFGAARTLLWETYLPAAQRRALYQALGSYSGISVTREAKDAAGRTGIGVGFAGPEGTRWELIFDRDSYALLGERTVVVDAKVAGSPVGTLVGASAQLEISVADSAPEIKSVPGDGCNRR